MNLYQELSKIGQKAKNAGLAAAVSKGKFQFQKVTHNKKGISTVIPLTDMMTMEKALIFDLSTIEGEINQCR